MFYSYCAYRMTIDTTNITNPEYDNRWRQFLYAYYTEAWQKSKGEVTLEDIYPLAQKKYAMMQKNCDIDLSLIANKRKHKKK